MSFLTLLPSWPDLSLFLIAAFALGVSPGPGMLYAVARGIGSGARGAVIATLGLSCGSFCNCVAAAVGLSAMLAASESAYDIVRICGAGYLAYLAVRTVRAPPNSLAIDSPGNEPAGTMFWQAVLTNVINPKSALFYLAFVPQFISPERGNVLIQFLLLGAVFNVFGNTVNLLVAIGFGRMSDWLRQRPGVWRVQQWLTASILGGLALHLLFSTRR